MIENFKYIPSNTPLMIEPLNCNIVILDGQNGYGKTTLFDAIELLINGTIKHFNANLPNRGLESISVLANDNDEDIVITAWLCSHDNPEVKVERRFLSNQEFKNVLIWNEGQISQDELYEKLKTSSNMFNIGTYISQSQSLNFLQNKYNNRKEQVSTLLDNPEVVQKLQLLRDVQDILKSRTAEQLDILSSQEKDLKEQVIYLESLAKGIDASDELPGENIRLFPAKEYAFDLIRFTEDTSYEDFILPIKQLEAFIKNYHEYVKYFRNRQITRLLEIPKKIYMAQFYTSQILTLNENISWIETLSKCRDLLGKLKQHQWCLDNATFLTIGIPEDVIWETSTLLQAKQDEQNKLNDSDRVLFNLNKTRLQMIEQFKIAVKQGAIGDLNCPLCGTNLSDINKAFEDTEKFLSSVHQDSMKRINQIEDSISQVFNTKIIPFIEIILTENNNMLKINDAVSSCKNLSTEELTELLKTVGISGFFSSMDNLQFDIEEFSMAFDSLQTQLKQLEQPISIIISEHENALYKNIHYTYYNNQQPTHTLDQIESKKQYVTKCFFNKIALKLNEARQQSAEATDAVGKYKEKSNALLDAMKNLIQKYDDSYKEYQSLLANAIRIPLMVYSGKIIQNYPLGLGIKAVIRTNQLIFVPASKNDEDAYNILSTGQLNGLAIAILLSVRNVYGHPKGLDIILIDDPLQTIDDISAISLADLLAHQNIGQIILSTHEDQKARLLRYKFEQVKLSVCEKNMQQMYLSLKE